MEVRNKVQEYYDSFCDLMQKDTKGVEIGIYLTSGVLFGLAYYKIRPITKFGKPSDIPKHFIQTRLKQYGTISGVDPSSSSGPLLLINHKPPLNFLIPSRKLLPVKLSGISINANGYSWLQTVAVNHQVEFIPLRRNPDNVECQVLMHCPNNKKVRLDITEAILSLGFGKLVNPPKELDDQIMKRYYKYLQYVEQNAKDDRKGLWSHSLPPVPWPIKKLKDIYKAAIFAVLPANRRLPELVR